MKADQRNAWTREALDMAFDALASHPPLRDALVYKGGRVLAIRLGGQQRASYDLDANLLLGFSEKHPTRKEQADVLRDLFNAALSAHVEAQDPVRYALKDVRVLHTPPDDHPLGWGAFSIKVRLADAMHENVRGLPTIHFDVAAPETLGCRALAPLEVGEGEVLAYTLERIAGEKHRAFLSSLPQYRLKVKKPGDAVRVKDLYDIAKILRVRPIEDIDFWMAAAEEFRLACESRFVDCMGIESFSEELSVTQGSYIGDSTLPSDVSWEDAWNSVQTIVRFWVSRGLFPLAFNELTISDKQC
jgi:hypothetical protein